MKASDTDLKSLIEGVKQFMIPVYQRRFSWSASDQRTKKMTVEKMWNDISDLMEDNHGDNDGLIHFFGSIVTMPVLGSASEVSKFIVIDGQQRLISSFILLSAIRNEAASLKFDDKSPYSRFVKKLENEYIFNEYRETQEKYKLMPAMQDRADFFDIIDGKKSTGLNGRIASAYRYFQEHINKKTKPLKGPDEIAKYLESLKNTLLKRLRIVDVRLDQQDDPHDIFESLNYTGIPLSNWDLAKNYLLMHYEDPKIQEDRYSHIISLIEKNIETNSEDFLRDFISMNGIFTTTRDIYSNFKLSLSGSENEHDIAYWDDKLYYLNKVSNIYYNLFYLENIEDPAIKVALYFTKNILGTDTHFPILMKLFMLHEDGYIDGNQLRLSVEKTAAYLLKESFTLFGMKAVNKVFPNIAKSLDGNALTQLSNEFSTDKDLEDELYRYDFSYKDKLARYLLFRLEQQINKEAPSFDKIQLEHIMPQTLTQDWKDDLGDDWENIHKDYLNRLGNLTITGYNQTLGNDTFNEKKTMDNGYKDSSMRITRDLIHYERWGPAQIEERGKRIAKEIAKMWLI